MRLVPGLLEIRMTLDEALAYLTPHRLTGPNSPVLLTAHKMRTAVAVIEAALGRRPESATPPPPHAPLSEPKDHP